MKKLLFILIGIALAIQASSQERPRVAILDPTFSGMSDDGTKVAVREIISSTIVNLGSYSIVERSLLEKVMAEQKFSNSGAVDDSQATEIGKLSGAKKVIVSVITKTNNRRMLTVKMIDVKTATVERQKFKIVSDYELLDIVAPITLEVFKQQKISYNGISETHNPTSSVEKSLSEGEIRLFLPSGYKPDDEKHNDNIIKVYMDGEQIGAGTLSEGFDITVKDPKPGKHKLKFVGRFRGETSVIKINTSVNHYFEFMIARWVYLGAKFYPVQFKEARPY